jgi:hypothetical protein
MVLSDLAALPWLKDPAAEVRRLFDLGDVRQAEQLAGHLADLDCVLLAQVVRLRQAAQAWAAPQSVSGAIVLQST